MDVMNKPALRRFIAFFMLFPSVAALSSAQDATLSGHVYYKNGSPAVGATVEVHAFAPTGGILPPPVLTDNEGKFTIVYPPLGRGTLSASKVSEGFPNLDLAIYGRSAFSQLMQVDLTPGLEMSDISLKLADPYEVIKFGVVDGQTGGTLTSARIYIQLSDDDRAMVSSTIDETGEYILCLPHHDLLVRISAPGYSDWNRQFPGAGSDLPGPNGLPKPLAVRLTRSGG
jgi:hypothetical protein